MKKSSLVFAILIFMLTNPLHAQTVTLDYTAGKVNEAGIDHGGLKRKLLYYVPKDFDLGKKHALIFIIHGFNQPVDTIVSAYAVMQAKADADGTILAYPVATGEFEKKSLAWNTRYGGSTSSKLPETAKVDDVGFISRIIDTFIGNMNADPDRVYVTGTSLGGAMTYALSVCLPERLAAIAPVIMQVGSKFAAEFRNAKPLPIMIITGTADPLVSPKGSDPSSMISIVSDEANIAYWKARNGVTGDPIEIAMPNPVTEVFKGAPAPSSIVKYSWKSPSGNDIVWLKVINGGHWLPTYAGGKAVDASNINGFDGSYMGNLNCDYAAAEGIYDFLMSHLRKKNL